MDNISFICDKETVTFKMLCRIMDKTTAEIIELAKKVGVNNTFKHAGYIYQVVNSDVNTPMTIGRTGNKRFNVTNAVKSNKNMPRKRLYLVDGVEATKEDIECLLGISKIYLKTLLTKVVSITINGYNIEIKDNSYKYTPIKDGKKYPSGTISECSTLTGISEAALKQIYDKKTYSTKDGWRLI